jgi:hypothetical protein
VIRRAVLSDTRRAWLTRVCATYFIAAIVVPTMAPFRAIAFSDLVRKPTSLSGRVAPIKSASRDAALASTRLRKPERRLKNRLKSIAGADQASKTIPPAATSRRCAADDSTTAHPKPLPILRI